MMARKTASPRSHAGRRPAQVWRLHLYVTGRTSKSLAAYSNLKAICEGRMLGCYTIHVIDVAEQPHKAKEDQIYATPMVIRMLPRPIRSVIGNLSDAERLLIGLDLTPAT